MLVENRNLKPWWWTVLQFDQVIVELGRWTKLGSVMLTLTRKSVAEQKLEVVMLKPDKSEAVGSFRRLEYRGNFADSQAGQSLLDTAAEELVESMVDRYREGGHGSRDLVDTQPVCSDSADMAAAARSAVAEDLVQNPTLDTLAALVAHERCGWVFLKAGGRLLE